MVAVSFIWERERERERERESNNRKPFLLLEIYRQNQDPQKETKSIILPETYYNQENIALLA